jgi:uncharacterized protein (DUF433 family)
MSVGNLCDHDRSVPLGKNADRMDTLRRTGKVEREPSVFDAPSYRAGEVAHLLKLPYTTVSSWCFGHGYRNRQGARKTFHPVIEPADSVHRLLSFSNLCELHVLGAITRHHRIPLQRVRSAILRVRKAMHSPRPLLAEDFRTNGLHLFLEDAGQLVNVSGGGQAAFRGEFERALNRIERGAGGAPVRLFPFSRKPARMIEQPQVIAIDPRIAFGRPIVAKARVRTDVIYDRFGAGDSPAEMAGDYGVGEEDVLEALRYEQSVAA